MQTSISLLSTLKKINYFIAIPASAASSSNEERVAARTKSHLFNLQRGMGTLAEAIPCLDNGDCVDTLLPHHAPILSQALPLA